MFKFDASKVKARLEEAKQRLEEAKKNKNFKEKDIHTDILVKVDKEGDYNFRAFPYVHNEDFLSDPFPDRFYHFGIPGVGTVFCPQKNTGGREKCAICDFVWDQMKANKGNSVETKKWSERLPKRRLLIPGIIRGREEEGIKFFSLSTNNEEPGKMHALINKWLTKESTQDFLDPVNGYDMILSYEKYDEDKSKKLNGAKMGFEKLDLDRDRTPIATDPRAFWETVEATLKNVDKDIPGFEIKTYEDTLDVLTKWRATLDKRAKVNKPIKESKDSDGSIAKSTSASVESKSDDAAKDVAEDERPVDVAPTAKIEVKSETKVGMTAEERKARAKELLRRNSATA